MSVHTGVFCPQAENSGRSYLPLFPFVDVLYIPEVYRVCNAGLYYIHVRKRTFGDTVLKKIFYFLKPVVCYLVALMLTVLLCAEFALEFDAQTALTL